MLNSLLQVLSPAQGERREVGEGRRARLSASEHRLHWGPRFPLRTLHQPPRPTAVLWECGGVRESPFCILQHFYCYPLLIFECYMLRVFPLFAARVFIRSSYSRGGVSREARSRHSPRTSLSSRRQDCAFHQRHRSRWSQPYTVSVSLHLPLWILPEANA